ncbi:MAG: lamin tail domain-containing protein, partial [Verrucomicrobiota bacterium]
LSGYFLANNYSNVAQWSFPPGTMINAGEYLLVWADGEPAQTSGTNYHANFRLNATNGSVVLARNLNGSPQVLDYINYANVGENRSYGSHPPGQLSYRQTFYFPTPRLANDSSTPPVTLFINEWMASNSSFLRDPMDQDFDDWIELYNPSAAPVDLAGFRMTDDLADPVKFLIPAGITIPANGFLMVWADDEIAQTRTNGDLHVNFKLSKSGEQIALYDPSGRMVDAVAFGAQSDNVSEGRWRDGSPARYFMTTPTPGAPNVIPILNSLGTHNPDASIASNSKPIWTMRHGPICRATFPSREQLEATLNRRRADSAFIACLL